MGGSFICRLQGRIPFLLGWLGHSLLTPKSCQLLRDEYCVYQKKILWKIISSKLLTMSLTSKSFLLTSLWHLNKKNKHVYWNSVGKHGHAFFYYYSSAVPMTSENVPLSESIISPICKTSNSESALYFYLIIETVLIVQLSLPTLHMRLEV